MMGDSFLDEIDLDIEEHQQSGRFNFTRVIGDIEDEEGRMSEEEEFRESSTSRIEANNNDERECGEEEDED